MWPVTRLTKKLHIKLPIIQAPMAGGATTPELVAAVSNAGGLGSFAAGYLSATEIKAALKQIRALTDQIFAVNLFVPQSYHAASADIEKAKNEINQLFPTALLTSILPPYVPDFREQIEILIAEKVPVFSFTFGIPAPEYLQALRVNGTVIIGTATHLAEAKLLEQNGVDVIIAQGSEAGGHRGTFIGPAEDALIGLMALLPQLVDQVRTPIVAAGGIMDARGIVAALALGAVGVQMGTAFMGCKESGIHSKYKQLLFTTDADNTTLTRVFSGKMARGIKNQFIKTMTDHAASVLNYPIQHALTRTMRKAAEQRGDTDFMSLWSGQAAYLSQDLSATDLLQKLNQDVAMLLQKIVS